MSLKALERDQNTPMSPDAGFFDLGERIRWGLFRALEAVSQKPTTDSTEHSIKSIGQPTIWIFASTIGELNAIQPFIRKLLEVVEESELVFISDHGHYRQAYAAQYPQAAFFSSKGASHDAEHLASTAPPRLLIIAEIPCILSDAPCRFSYAFLRAAKEQAAPVVIVNGWLYEQAPGCRLDEWEKRILLPYYLKAVDLACVQVAEVAEHLTDYGLNPDRILVTGSMKFDALAKPIDWAPESTRSPIILAELNRDARPIVVAGCIKKAPEQSMIVESFTRVLSEIPDALLVFAHRHPEVSHNLDILEADLDRSGVRHMRRTRLGDHALASDIQCLILDTMGELKDYYAVATVAHVGVDHNLLEPLSFGKPVTTPSNWLERFPNFPVFQALHGFGGIVTADDPLSLSTQWIGWIKDPSTQGIGLDARSKLTDISGASELTLEAINRRALLGSGAQAK